MTTRRESLDGTTVWLSGENIRPGQFRKADIYAVHGAEPRRWRIRAERYPEHNEGNSGWFGGRVLWGSDQDTRELAEQIGLAWVERGELPPIHP